MRGIARSISARVISKSEVIFFPQLPIKEPNSGMVIPESLSWPATLSNSSSGSS